MDPCITGNPGDGKTRLLIVLESPHIAEVAVTAIPFAAGSDTPRIHDLVWRSVSASLEQYIQRTGRQGRRHYYIDSSSPDIYVVDGQWRYLRIVDVLSSWRAEQDAAKRDLLRVGSEIKQKALEYLAQHPNLLHELNWRRLEELVAELARRTGYTVHLSRQGADQGCDVRGKRSDGELVQYQCKRWAAHRPVRAGVVREFNGVVESATRRILVTTSRFTKAAMQLAARCSPRIELVDFHGLVQWIRAAASLG